MWVLKQLMYMDLRTASIYLPRLDTLSTGAVVRPSSLLFSNGFRALRGDMTLNVDEFPGGRKYSDTNLSITPVFIGGNPAGQPPPLPAYSPKEVR